MTGLPGKFCAVCGQENVQAIAPGDEPTYSDAGHILLEKGRDDLCLCLADAAKIGWPWPSEMGKTRQKWKAAK
jgi:hypothetical protein